MRYRVKIDRKNSLLKLTLKMRNALISMDGKVIEDVSELEAFLNEFRRIGAEGYYRELRTIPDVDMLCLSGRDVLVKVKAMIYEGGRFSRVLGRSIWFDLVDILLQPVGEEAVSEPVRTQELVDLSLFAGCITPIEGEEKGGLICRKRI